MGKTSEKLVFDYQSEEHVAVLKWIRRGLRFREMKGSLTQPETALATHIDEACKGVEAPEVFEMSRSEAALALGAIDTMKGAEVWGQGGNTNDEARLGTEYRQRIEDFSHSSPVPQ
jgi:hypothetical protein